MTKRPALVTLSQGITTNADGEQTLLPSRDQILAQTAPAPAPAVDVPGVREVQPIDLDALSSAVADRIASHNAGRRSPLSRFTSAQDWLLAARTGDPDALATFVIADQVTSENPGVMANGWVNDVKGIVERGTRAINALGGRAPLPDAGLSVDWPYFDGDLTTIIGEQTTQKTDVTSVDVSIKKGTSAIKTLAGGSDIAWQLIKRSSPDYVSAYLRILAAAFGVIEDKTFLTAAASVDKAVSAEIVLDLVAAGTTADAIKAKVFEASSRIDLATGAPATALLAATDVYNALGGKFVSPDYGVQNQNGVASASSLRLEVSGLAVTHCPSLANGVMLAANDLAVRWHGTGPMAASADDVLKLGTDQVLWGMGTTAIYVPTGIVRFQKVATP